MSNSTQNIWRLMLAGAAFGLVAGILGTLAWRGFLPNNLKPDLYTWMLIGIMLVAGLIGGAVNYFLAQGDAVANINMRRSLFTGVGAATLVPLFLNMLSSNLLERARNEPLQQLVFFGFCLIAAITSKAFINTLADRLLRDIQDTKQTAKEASNKADNADNKAEEANTKADEANSKAEDANAKADTTAEVLAPIVAKETEPSLEEAVDDAGESDPAGEDESSSDTETESEPTGDVGAVGARTRGMMRGGRSVPSVTRSFVMPSVTERFVLTDSEKEVLFALGDSRYTLRSANGIKSDLRGRSRREVLNALNSLVAKELAGVMYERQVEPFWYLTIEGRNLLHQLQLARGRNSATSNGAETRDQS